MMLSNHQNVKWTLLLDLFYLKKEEEEDEVQINWFPYSVEKWEREDKIWITITTYYNNNNNKNK